VTITATFNGVPGTATLTVTPAVVSSVTVSPATASVAAGNPASFTATANFSDGSTQPVTGTAAWTSSNEAVATVASGAVTTLTAGTVTITATFNGVPGTATLTVTPAELLSVAVTPTTASIPALGVQEFTATATYTNGPLDVTAEAIWESSNPSAATIDALGVASAEAVVVEDTTTITATFEGVPGTATLTVTPGPGT
jgi:uncharacterized protein YjdB